MSGKNTQSIEYNSAPPQKRRSISRTLTILLTVTVVVVSIFSVAVIYYFSSQKGHAQLLEKADGFMEALVGALEISLWNMDREQIKKIGDAYAQNEVLETLTISDNKGYVYYDLQRASGAPLIRRSAKISHNGHENGNVTMALTTKFQLEQNRRLLFAGIGLLLAVILALILVPRLFFKNQIDKLVRRLEMIADAYASGTYNAAMHNMPFYEFQPLIGILRGMRDKLNAQLDEIRKTEKKYRGIFENAVEGIFQTMPDGRIANANPAMVRMLGYESVEELKSAVPDIGKIYCQPEQRKEFVHQLAAGKEVSGFQTRFFRKDGSIVWGSTHARPIFDATGKFSMIEGITEDITEQKRAEETQRTLEQQLQQSQKLESVGKLAGGIAHDFNNMLGIILGYSEMILEDLTSEYEYYNQLLEIKKAAERSGNLTRQLLAFARKQTASPEVLNLNATVSGMLKMLTRLIGEDINLVWLPGDDLAAIKVDPSQIDQILANLCINARDAISGTGTITIETMNKTIDANGYKDCPDIVSGDYVLLSVSDSGTGIDESIIHDIFEPFFSTKEYGKGTGLGLATVYGIVKQNNGAIHVSSKPDQGTTFKIFFPVCEAALSTHSKISPEASLSGNETVLLVEDEARLLPLGKDMLTKLGYNVLTAGSPSEAIHIAESYAGNIHLIITDVIMPEMNGSELSDRLISDRPDAKCLFMSGYTADVISDHGVLREGTHFIHKPFTRMELASKVRSVLDYDRSQH